MPEAPIIEYKLRLHSVFDYIDRNLTEDLSLKKLSALAFFSPFHFHRIFKYVTNETLKQYITRIKVEKSAIALLHRNESIQEIALQCGFSENSSYTRAFKKFYHSSPSEFRKQHPHTYSKIRQIRSKKGQAYPSTEAYICLLNKLRKYITMHAKIEIIETQETTHAAVRHVGFHGVERAFDKLIRWANGQGLINKSTSKMGRLFYDSAKITDSDKIRMSIFLQSEESYTLSGEVHNLCIKSGKYIVGHFEISPMEFEKSWTGLYLWMNEQGYKKRDAYPYEIYHNDYREHPENKFIVDLYIPIE